MQNLSPDLFSLPAHKMPMLNMEAEQSSLPEYHTTMVQEWLPVFIKLGFGISETQKLAHIATRNGTSIAREIISNELTSEEVLFSSLAEHLNLPFITEIDPSHIVLDEQQREFALSSRSGMPLTILNDGDGRIFHLLTLPDIDPSIVRTWLSRWPDIADKIIIAPPSSLRKALMQRSRDKMLDDAQNRLFLRMPEYCARIVASGRQGIYVGMLLIAFPILLAMWPFATMMALHFIGFVAFSACIALRVMALSGLKQMRLTKLPDTKPRDLPVYSVLVALYHEREVLPQLLAALERLKWPHSKLEIKLVCEADDYETLDYLRAQHLKPWFEVVEVPPGLPRTKPKALAYALPLTSGEFITLYDAEDRPHPLQLLAAWHRFKSGDGNLACLQAPLIVTNTSASPLSRMFGFEYSGLFRGLLPFLARNKLVVPPGGTSNHFRRAALMEIGGWDAHNVTEDADLGVRFKRFGYDVDIITYPTFEDGPEELGVWLPQRIRWFKGWLQTWLVHMRAPRKLWHDLGATSFVTMQILFAGALLSALIHPFFLASIFYALTSLLLFGASSFHESIFAAFGLANVLAGYAAFIALGWSTLLPSEKKSLPLIIALTPLHWILLSVAAWLSLWELYRRPYHWNKTPHREARRSSQS